MKGEKDLEDPGVHRLWIVAQIAKEFGVLPSAVARDFDSDPEQTSAVCLSLLRFAEAKAAYETANKKVLEAWEGSPMMAEVEEIEGAIAQQAIDRQRAEIEGRGER